VQAARKDAEALAGRISGQTLRFTARVGELDRLYGSITSSDIAEKILSQTGVEIDRRKIDLDEPLKRIGIYPIKVRLMSGLEPLVNVVVEGEEGAIQLQRRMRPSNRYALVNVETFSERFNVILQIYSTDMR
jgi:large subunit ribosomal protein L9